MFKYYASVILLLCCSSVKANVIGIDIGSDNFKVAMVQPGNPLEIVTNFQSKRKTPTCVAFYRNERTFGADATALMARKPELTFSRLTRLIGRIPEHPSVSKELKAHYFPYEVYTNQSWGGTCIKHEDTQYTPEELIAMLLQHAKDMTQNHGGKLIKDCVITVPSSFTQRERVAMFTAAEIADLKVLTLIEENTAAALHFGMDRVFEEPHRVLFYNMGASEVQVSIVTYSSYMVKEAGKNKSIGQFEVAGKGWDTGLGSFTFDLRLADLMATRFNEVWNKKASGKGKDIRDFLRPMTRLRVEASKIREVLSANSEFPVKTEQLHADTDLITKITRNDFEKACEDLYTRFTVPVDKALAMANLTLADINAVELLGGGVRMPKVKKLLEDYFKIANLDLGQHLNGDEAMALGSAFRAANLSTAFRVRKVGVSDINSFGVSVRIETLSKETGFFDSMMGMLKRDTKKDTTTGDNWEKHASLYPRMSAVPGKTKTVAFQYDKDILCKLEYDDDVPLPEGTGKFVAVYNITGIADFAKETASKGLGLPKVHLSFGLDSSGIVNLLKAEATVDLPPEVEEVKVEVEKEETAASASSTSSDADKSSDAASNSTDSTNTTSTTAATDKKTKKEKKEKPAVKKDTILRKALIVEENHQMITPATWTPALISAARHRLKALDAADAARKAKEAAMNELEGYLYKVKNRLSDDETALAAVSTEVQRQEVMDLASQTLEWLEEEGTGQEVGTYKNKLSEVKRKAEAIFLRYSETTDRPAAVAKARRQLADVRTKVSEWEKKMPQVTEEEKIKLLEMVDKAEQWLDDKETAQKGKSATEEALFHSEDVPAQLKLLGGQYERLLRKPKPVPEKVKVVNGTVNANTTTNANGTDSNGGNSTEKVEIKIEGDSADAGEEKTADAEKTATADEL